MTCQSNSDESISPMNSRFLWSRRRLENVFHPGDFFYFSSHVVFGFLLCQSFLSWRSLFLLSLWDFDHSIYEGLWWGHLDFLLIGPKLRAVDAVGVCASWWVFVDVSLKSFDINLPPFPTDRAWRHRPQEVRCKRKAVGATFCCWEVSALWILVWTESIILTMIVFFVNPCNGTTTKQRTNTSWMHCSNDGGCRRPGASRWVPLFFGCYSWLKTDHLWPFNPLYLLDCIIFFFALLLSTAMICKLWLPSSSDTMPMSLILYPFIQIDSFFHQGTSFFGFLVSINDQSTHLDIQFE